ncbi:MAG: APC family permease [Chloroflexota bacterium]|nr:APC family permease [Chloroflexota bacterium]
MSEHSSRPALSPEERGNLRSNTIGLPGVLFQSITTMAPASAVAFSLAAAIPAAGGALPLATIIALIVCVLVALNIGALAKYLPSAGGYFTYVSRGLGPQAGWMVGWLFNLAYLLIVPFQLLVLGPVADSFCVQYFHLSLGWVPWVVIFAVVIFLLTSFGIKISADVGVILGCIEIAVFVLLSLWLIVVSGSKNTFAVFTPTYSLQAGLGGWQGVLFGMLFVFTAFSGFESAAPLAEESRNPRQIVPRAMILAPICIGIFYVLCSYAGVVSWGVEKLAGYTNDPNPWATLAHGVWGPFSFIVILTILNSALANSNAGVNAVTRVLYAMGRTRTLPAFLARLNRYQIPDIAAFITMVVAVIVAIWSGVAFGPFPGAFSFVGAVLTIPILLVYIATCAAVPFFYRREHRDELSIVRHVIVPILPLFVLLCVLYFQFSPLPAAPLLYAGPIVLVWLVLGLIIVILLSLRAPATLAQASRIYVEEEETHASSHPVLPS